MLGRDAPAHSTLDDKLLLAGGLGRFQYAITAFAFAVWAVHGAQVMSMAFVGPAVVLEYDQEGAAIRLSGSFFFAGWLLGLLVWGRLAGRAGWMRALAAELLGAAAAGVAGAFATSGKGYLVARFMCGFAEGGVPTTVFGWAGEFLLPQHKPRCLLVLQIGFKVGSLLVTLGAYTGGYGRWRQLSIAISVCALPFAGLALVGAPESPRWLQANGRQAEAEEVLALVAAVNAGVPFVRPRLSKLASTKSAAEPKPAAAKHLAAQSTAKGTAVAKGPSSPSSAATTATTTPTSSASPFAHFIFLLRSERALRRVLLVLCLHWLAYSALFFGLSLHEAADLQETTLAVALQIPGVALTALLFDRYGRRRTILGLLIAAALSCAAIAIESTAGVLRMRASARFHAILSTLGMVFMSSAFAGGYVLSSEALPTSCRAMGLAMCSQVARLGGFLSPLLLLLGEGSIAVPYVLWAALAAAASLATLWLPETLGEPSVETVDDLRALVQRQRPILGLSYLFPPGPRL